MANIDNSISNIASHVFGCRSQHSNGNGWWDGAFIYIKTVDGNNVSVVFQNNMDFIEKLSIDDAIKTYSHFILQGWNKMTIDDIKITARVIINDNTNFNPTAS
jgi:hypothetical protein